MTAISVPKTSPGHLQPIWDDNRSNEFLHRDILLIRDVVELLVNRLVQRLHKLGTRQIHDLNET